MKTPNIRTKAVRGVALTLMTLALWPSVVLIETPLDQAVKTVQHAVTEPATLVDAAQKPVGDGAYSEKSHWIIRIGIPLRPFCGADFIRTIEGTTNGTVRTKTDETIWNSAHADPVGMLWTVLLMVCGWMLLRFTDRRRSEGYAAPSA